MPAAAGRSASPELAGERATKKLKRAIACNECRDRKIRCNQKLPCDACCRRNSNLKHGVLPIICEYPTEVAQKAAINNDYVKQLEQRVRELEATSCRNDAIPASEQGRTFLTPVHALRQRSSVSDSRSSSTPARQGRPPSPSIEISQPREGLDDIDDEQNADGPDLPVGESSVSGFILHARDTLQDRASSKATSSSHTGNTNPPWIGPKFSLRSWQNHLRSRQRLSACVEGMTVPSREFADELMGRFWSHEYPLMPLLHRPTFMRKYHQMWDNYNAERDAPSSVPLHIRGSFLCLLYAILALSQRKGEELNRKDLAIHLSLFESSKQLLYSGLLESGSMEVVQALVYGAHYLRRIGQHHEAWLFVGSAGRLAQALGFHHTAETGSQVEREIKRRLWYGAMQTDILHTTAFGQAPITLNVTLPLPSMVDDIYFETDSDKSDAQQPDGIIPDIAFFIHQIKLSMISVNILRSIYHSQHGSLKAIPDVEFQSAVIRYDMELEQWEQELLDYLNYEKADEYPGEVRLRQMAFLQVRYLECRFLLFRAAVLRLAGDDETKKSLLQRSIARTCVDSCVSAMRREMAIFEKFRQTSFIQAPNHNIATLLIIATVLALLVRSPSIEKLVGPEEHQTHLALAAECMRRLRSYDLSSFPRQRGGPVDAIDRLLRMEVGAETRERVERYAQGHCQTANGGGDASSVQPDSVGTVPPFDGNAQMQPDFGGHLNPELFNVSAFLGSLTDDLQNPQTWFGGGLEQFGAGFNDEFGTNGATNGWDNGYGLNEAVNEPQSSLYAMPQQQYGASLWNAPI